MAQPPNHYEILGLELSASAMDIKRSYTELAMKLHPDKVKNHNNTTRAFQLVQEAYEVLKDEETRSKYDLELRQKNQRSDVPVSVDLDLDDLDESGGPDGALTFSKICRCGGAFAVRESDLDERSDHVIVQCSTCSLFARIYYTVAKDG